MKLFKQTDAWISVALILACSIINIRNWSPETLKNSYYVIGLWQVISMLVHTINHWFMKKQGIRRYYHWLTICIFAVAFLGLAYPPLLLLVLDIMLFISPFLAIVYTTICFTELQELKLAHSFNLK